ncbi:MAG: hypothetical protein AUJ98_09585 [Bacteroidetes bacterium CG2_30_33_31]|nr:MAG: hypothetical protein AUJ98_09585 [Bacteroidetes bacterium CG2_30_33_31]
MSIKPIAKGFMEESKELMEIDFNKEKLGTPFTTPDGYFENLKSEIFKKTIYSSAITKTMEGRLWLKFAVAASISIILITAVLFITTQNENSTLSLAKTEKDINPAIKSLKNNKSILAKETISNSKDDSVLEKGKRLKYQNNNEIRFNNRELNILNNNHKPAKQEQNSVVEIAEIQNNNFLISPQFPIINQQVQNGGQSTSHSSSIVAKKSNPIKIINLASDTCSVSPIFLSIDNNSSILKKYDVIWSTGENTLGIWCYKSDIYSVRVYNKGEKNPVETSTIKVNIIEKPEPNLGMDQTICSNESLELDANTSNENYSYTWSLSNSKSNKLFIKHLPAGNYKIRVKVKACNYETQDEMQLTVNECILQFSNVITPNGDGKNDRFVISGLENYPGSSLYIVDRNGKTVYQSTNYQNNWDGNNLAEGTYFYLLKINDNEKSEKGGSLTIIRN